MDKIVFCRLIGLCLLQNELLPLYLCRHILKFIIGRKLGWHDLAFFDHVMYESLRQFVVSSDGKEAAITFAALDLNFSVDLCPEEVINSSLIIQSSIAL
jgi:E3 ubiquitin-protein ligase EDD1